MAALKEGDELVEQAADPLGVRAVDGDLVAAHVDRVAGELLLDHPEQLVALAEEAHHEVVAGDEDLDLGRRSRSDRAPR